ncbi:MAG TPA: nitrate reductase subunit beta [Anaeromyxobacteraceae bacterium]|nr:nitrate reductase subunit beta [Anaeromyxobacteraceae bacterium]
MDVRAQLASVFHLDKCLGCHTCSVVCKNVWTDRPGAEYMWWNNVETRPGTGYPRGWEDQDRWRGGWQAGDGGGPALRSGGRLSALAGIFHNPALPTLDDYYEPWTYRYGDLFDARASDVQPTARPVSLVTGAPLEVKKGPNWDDDLAGSKEYAARDPNLDALSPAERGQLFGVERLAFFHLPRTCNHCTNAACVAACPSGAIYKRGEDGLVVASSDRCRGWRQCISSCPYKKVFYNWKEGRSEKCIGCYPRVESGEAPACFAACPGRIRFQGVLLYDAERIREAAGAPERELVAAQRRIVLDPYDPEVAAAAGRCGLPEGVLAAARRSPAYAFVKRWEIALPLHPEWRTLPNVFYVPPLLPLFAEKPGDVARTADGLFTDGERSRIPLAYLARLFSGGDGAVVALALRKLVALRLWRRAETVGDVGPAEVEAAFAAARLCREDAAELHRLTTHAVLEERVVLPPALRAEAMAPGGQATA